MQKHITDKNQDASSSPVKNRRAGSRNNKRTYKGLKSLQCKTRSRKFGKYGIWTRKCQQTSVTPYSCEICQKKFPHHASLKTHTQIHYGDNMFQCEICFRHFCNKTELSDHLLVHTGEMPYTCDILKKNTDASKM